MSTIVTDEHGNRWVHDWQTDVDWTGENTIINASTDPDVGGTEVGCPCGWRALIGEHPGIHASPAQLLTSIARAGQHAATHDGGVHLIIRDAAGDIVNEGRVIP